MKKIVIVIVLILSILLIGCNKNKEDDKFDINKLLTKEYSNIDISIKTTKDNLSLQSSYKLTKSDNKITFNYSIEKYNTLDINNPGTTEKKTSKGTIEYVNGEKRVIEGEDIDYNVNNMSLSNLKFDGFKFDSLEVTDTKTTIKSKQVSNYLKANETFNDFNMVLTYNKDSISKVEIDYIDKNGSSVEIEYIVK